MVWVFVALTHNSPLQYTALIIEKILVLQKPAMLDRIDLSTL